MVAHNALYQHPEDLVFLGFLVDPKTHSADNTPAAVSIKGYSSVRVVVGWGAGGITFDDTDKIEVKLRDGDGTVGNHAAVDAADVVMPAGVSLGSNGIVKSFTAAATAGARVLHYVGAESYLSALADFSGTHGVGTGLYVAAFGMRGRANPAV